MRAQPVALVGILALTVGWTLSFVLQGSPIYGWALLALGAGLVVLAFIIDFARVKDVATSRPGRFGVSMTVSVALALAIVFLVNAISYRHHLRFDLTWLRQFTLTAQTKEALGDLNNPVEVAVVFAPGATGAIGDYAETLLAEYQLYTDMLTVHRVDPDISPDRVRRYGVDQMGAALGVVVFSGAAGQRHVLAPRVATEAEHAFTAAILEASGTGQKKVYFLVGDGEPRIDSDYSLAAAALRDNLYQVEEFDLGAAGGIPQDAAAAVLAGPRQPLGVGEADELHRYLDGGGGLLVLIDPNPPADIRRFLADSWIEIEDGTLVDPSSHVVPSVDVPLVGRDRNSFGLPQTYFPGATALIPSVDLPDGVDMAALVWTSGSSWLERLPLDPGGPEFDPKTDRKGPLAIGSLMSMNTGDADNSSQRGRLAVIGDSDFATNRHVQSGNNADLFVSTVNWVTADKRLVSVGRKALNIRRLVLSPQQVRLLNLSSIALLPLVLLVVGGFHWWRRR